MLPCAAYDSKKKEAVGRAQPVVRSKPAATKTGAGGRERSP